MIGGSAFDSLGQYDERAAMAHEQEHLAKRDEIDHAVAAGIAAATGPAWDQIIPSAAVNLPADLMADARRMHAQIQARNRAHGTPGYDFETWLAEIIRDAVYGPGFDPGEAADWLDR